MKTSFLVQQQRAAAPERFSGHVLFLYRHSHVNNMEGRNWYKRNSTIQLYVYVVMTMNSSPPLGFPIEFLFGSKGASCMFACSLIIPDATA